MRIVFFGSGAFGVPTLRALARAHDVPLVVTQPDRPAGRNRRLAPTPVAEAAAALGLASVKPESCNAAEAVTHVHAQRADAFVVIAYGQKLGHGLLADRFAINLHASLLPKFRGAAPITWAIIRGERVTGLSVISLADRMDAGDVFGQVETPIDPMETAGELHDRLAALGPDLVLRVLEQFAVGAATSCQQNEVAATLAPKLTKADGMVSFDASSVEVRNRVHGLTPWPGCRVTLRGASLRLHRVESIAAAASRSAPEQTPAPPNQPAPGTIIGDGRVACGSGSVRLLAVQPAGGKLMSFEAYCAGHEVADGDRLLPPTSGHGSEA
jgi:methionyl-tRNA formyltransferase